MQFQYKGRLVYCAYLMEARGRLSVTNETQNIDKVSYLHGHYLNAVYSVLTGNPPHRVNQAPYFLGCTAMLS